MKATNWNNVAPAEEKSYDRPSAGGYVCRIVNVEDNEEKEYVQMLLDICEGKYAGRGEAMESSMGVTWGYYTAWRSYKDSAQGFFRAFLDTLEASNSRFVVKKFSNDANEFRGLIVGVILRDEEYVNKNGEKKVRTAVYKMIPADDIRAGNYKVPGLKPLSKEDEAKVITTTSYVPFSDTNASVVVPF